MASAPIGTLTNLTEGHPIMANPHQPPPLCATCGVPITAAQPAWLTGKMLPRQWSDADNHLRADTPIPHDHSPTPLCACGHPAERAIGADPVRCGTFGCPCTHHPAPPWTPHGDPVDWRRIGREAHAAGQPLIPATDARVREALRGLPVGGGAVQIMSLFTDGWHAANSAPDDAVAAIVADLGLLITAAVELYREYGDVDDILSSSQVETLHRLAEFADALPETLSALDAWDVVSFATTAAELADRHPLRDQALRDAVERARTHLE
ncbi:MULTISPECIES: hypothetical protein [Nocardia]|uniref:hypothetical protein n=1 Tax=Nocardia TaxID=1817 RepID=UPI000D69E236|nr:MULTISPECIES: hypothetical protein [Nocardia]